MCNKCVTLLAHARDQLPWQERDAGEYTPTEQEANRIFNRVTVGPWNILRSFLQSMFGASTRLNPSTQSGLPDFNSNPERFAITRGEESSTVGPSATGLPTPTGVPTSYRPSAPAEAQKG